jgi:hypothetical protein
MKKVDRALQELTHFAQVKCGGLDIHFSGHHPAMFEIGGQQVPHKWQCHCGTNQESYHAYGVTQDDAVLECYRRFQAGDTSYPGGDRMRRREKLIKS